MIRYEDECVGPCPQGCMGSACKNKHVPHFYCDACGCEVDPDELHEDGVKGGHICMDCITDMYPKIKF